MKLLNTLFLMLPALAASLPVLAVSPNEDAPAAISVPPAGHWTFPMTFLEDCAKISRPGGSPYIIRHASAHLTDFTSPRGEKYANPGNDENINQNEADPFKSEHYTVSLPHMTLHVGPVYSPGSAQMAIIRKDGGHNCYWHVGDGKPYSSACGGCELKVPEGNSDPDQAYGPMDCTGVEHRVSDICRFLAVGYILTIGFRNDNSTAGEDRSST
jgi:hypothetical protein